MALLLFSKTVLKYVAPITMLKDWCWVQKEICGRSGIERMVALLAQIIEHYKWKWGNGSQVMIVLYPNRHYSRMLYSGQQWRLVAENKRGGRRKTTPLHHVILYALPTFLYFEEKNAAFSMFFYLLAWHTWTLMCTAIIQCTIRTVCIS